MAPKKIIKTQIQQITWNITPESKQSRIFEQLFGQVNENTNKLKFKNTSFTKKQEINKNLPNRRITNFNADGNYLCAGSGDTLTIWQLSENKISFQHKLTTPHEEYTDIKFLHSNENSNGLDLATAFKSGHIKQERILPTGGSVTLNQQNLKTENIEITPSPQTPNEVLCKSSEGCVYNIDFRCPREHPTPVIANSHQPIRTSLRHHPLKTEICCGAGINTVVIYDKRNFINPIQELKPFDMISQRYPLIAPCSYNFNGSEIAAFYYNQYVGIFKRAFGKYVYFKSFDFESPNPTMNYFGPESEYIIRCHLNGRRYLLNKITGLEHDAYNCDLAPLALSFAAHPTLPVIAETNQAGISIYAPQIDM